MIKRSLPAAAGLAILAGLLLAGGCKQGLGDRCQIDSDCEDGLYCELAGNSVAMGGSCRSRTVPSQDMSTPPPDMTATPDLTPAPDLPATDGLGDGGG